LQKKLENTPNIQKIIELEHELKQKSKLIEENQVQIETLHIKALKEEEILEKQN